MSDKINQFKNRSTIDVIVALTALLMMFLTSHYIPNKAANVQDSQVISINLAESNKPYKFEYNNNSLTFQPSSSDLKITLSCKNFPEDQCLNIASNFQILEFKYKPVLNENFISFISYTDGKNIEVLEFDTYELTAEKLALLNHIQNFIIAICFIMLILFIYYRIKQQQKL